MKATPDSKRLDSGVFLVGLSAYVDILMCNQMERLIEKQHGNLGF